MRRLPQTSTEETLAGVTCGSERRDHRLLKLIRPHRVSLLWPWNGETNRARTCTKVLGLPATCPRRLGLGAAGSSAGLANELSAGLIVMPGGTISSMRSSTAS